MVADSGIRSGIACTWMTETDQSGSELLERLVSGDRLALVRVTRLVTSRLRRLGAYDLRDEWDDICQEVVWALIHAVRSGRTPASEKVVAYINRVTWNQFVNYLRKHGNNPQSSAYRQQDGLCSVDLSTDATGSDVASRETRFAARQALAGLSQEWQTLLISHYVEGNPVRTLVESSGQSRATVNRELRRAREAFRDLFAGAEGEMRPSDPSVDTARAGREVSDHEGSER